VRVPVTCKAQRKQDLPVLVAVTARSVRRVSLQPLVQRARPGHKLGDRGSGDLLIRNQAVAIGVHGAFVGAAQTDDGSRYFPSLQVGVLTHGRRLSAPARHSARHTRASAGLSDEKQEAPGVRSGR
jgi:hypothetical protein